MGKKISVMSENILRDNNGRFVKGHKTSNTGRTWFKDGVSIPKSEEHKNKIGYAVMGKNNGSWKGDNLNYDIYHYRVNKIKFNFGFCETCGEIIKRLYLANMKNHEYTQNPDDYNYLCQSCHLKMDSQCRKYKKSQELILS